MEEGELGMASELIYRGHDSQPPNEEAYSPNPDKRENDQINVEGLIRLMEGEHIGPFNLGNPGEFTMLELAQVVKETIDPNARIEFRPNTEDDPHKRKPDITKFRQCIFGDHIQEAATSTTKSSSD